MSSRPHITTRQLLYSFLAQRLLIIKVGSMSRVTVAIVHNQSFQGRTQQLHSRWDYDRIVFKINLFQSRSEKFLKQKLIELINDVLTVVRVVRCKYVIIYFNCFTIILLLKTFKVIAVISHFNCCVTLSLGALIGLLGDNGDEIPWHVMWGINVSIQLLIRPRDIMES